MQIVRNKTTKEILRVSETPIRADGKVPPDMDPSLELIEVIPPPVQPAFDPATQKIAPTVTELGPIGQGFPIRMIQGWQVVALTQAELDAYNQAVADAAERQLMKAAVADFKASTGTQEQRLRRCEQALARILPDLYK